MQHINNDMDELFRRASENYPLNTDSSDWNAVVKNLPTEKEVRNNTFKDKKNYRHLLWLLLLLPLGLAYKIYFTDNGQKEVDHTSKNVINYNLQGSSVSKQPDPQSIIQKPSDVYPGKSLVYRTSSGVQFKTRGKLNSSINGESSLFIPSKQPNANPIQQSVSNIDLNSKGDDKNRKDVIPVVPGQPGGAKDNTVVEDTNVHQTKVLRKTTRKHPRGFYAGIIISPDLSNVKMQSVKTIGMSMGVIAGYQMNNKIRIESGVLWSKKNYYSEGKYFNTKNIYVPSGAKINSVNGACYMIEVPLQLKYNFGSAKTYISASAGISSYFMKKEKYVYEIDRSGQVYPYSSTYKKNSSNIVAVANLGVGYNRSLKNNISLRAEPYLKIPLSGMGIGSLPIMSTGINIGITKKISR